MTTPEVVTKSDEILVPLADASGSAAPDAKGDSPWASARARAMVPTTHSMGKISHVWRDARVEFRGDLRRWRLLTARPVSLRAWMRLLKMAIERVPAQSERLRALWIADNHSTGYLLAGLAVLLYLLAGAAWWIAGHPVRRWTFLFLSAATVIYWLVA